MPRYAQRCVGNCLMIRHRTRKPAGKTCNQFAQIPWDGNTRCGSDYATIECKSSGNSKYHWGWDKESYVGFLSNEYLCAFWLV
mmetsp:Transcript_25264/g.41807  ORF Transcript_25264/g.41807 Transcript_25264/m.41807 type:complete len:83 (+) Transcript_25264:43-291(+)